MTVVFGLGTRLRVRMRTTFENGVLRNGQQPGSAVNSFIDLGEFGAMKTLSGRIAPRCDKRTLLCLVVFRVAFGHFYESC